MTAFPPGAPPVPSPFADRDLVLLDLDGTIVDSAPGILGSLDHAFAACEEPHPGRDRLRTFIGPPLVDSFRDRLGMSPERSEQLRAAYHDDYVVHGYLAAEPYPGMAALIARLAAAGRTVAVATNKPETTARRIIAHRGLDGDIALVGGTDREAGRDGKAAVVASVLERLAPALSGGDPQALAGRAVMIGDRAHDAEGAADHGVPTVLVGWGYGGATERELGLPRAGSPEELSALLGL